MFILLPVRIIGNLFELLQGSPLIITTITQSPPQNTKSRPLERGAWNYLIKCAGLVINVYKPERRHSIISINSVVKRLYLNDKLLGINCKSTALYLLTGYWSNENCLNVDIWVSYNICSQLCFFFVCFLFMIKPLWTMGSIIVDAS